MRTVFSCICFLPPLFDALYRKDSQQLNEFANELMKLESEADNIKHTFRINMPNTLLLPVDREDLLRLISDQDQLADSAEEIAKTLLYRDMTVPDSLKELIDELLEGTMEISASAKSLIEQLDELLQVGFRGREQEKVEKMIAGVRREEHNIDNIMHRTRRALSENEQCGIDLARYLSTSDHSAADGENNVLTHVIDSSRSVLSRTLAAIRWSCTALYAMARR